MITNKENWRIWKGDRMFGCCANWSNSQPAREKKGHLGEEAHGYRWRKNGEAAPLTFWQSSFKSSPPRVWWLVPLILWAFFLTPYNVHWTLCSALLFVFSPFPLKQQQSVRSKSSNLFDWINDDLWALMTHLQRQDNNLSISLSQRWNKGWKVWTLKRKHRTGEMDQ